MAGMNIEKVEITDIKSIEKVINFISAKFQGNVQLLLGPNYGLCALVSISAKKTRFGIEIPLDDIPDYLEFDAYLNYYYSTLYNKIHNYKEVLK